MNTEACGEFCNSISPLTKSFLFMYTQNLQCSMMQHWKGAEDPLSYIKGLNFSQKGNGGLFFAN